MIYFQTDRGVLHQGHILDVLGELPAESVHMICTSPPYWGLRDYGIEGQVWEDPELYGDPFEHIWGDETIIKEECKLLRAKRGNRDGAAKVLKDKYVSQGQFCQHCNSWKGSLGLEPTVELYLSHLVQVFRGVWRVLHPSGCIWVNMGDSYGQNQGKGFDTNQDGRGRKALTMSPKSKTGLKPKDLCGIPWRVALALQADGWYLRSAMPWVKRSAMPESATDRPASALEYMFLFSKSPHYFFDMDAVRVAHKTNDKLRGDGNPIYRADHFNHSPGGRNYRNTDLFFESITPPHGMIFCGDELVGLDVNPQALKSVVFYGSYRITSQYCPIHGCQVCHSPFQQDDGQQDVCQKLRSLYNDNYPAVKQATAVFAKLLDQNESPSDGSSAIPHNNQNHKKGDLLVQDVTFSDKLFSHTECKGPHNHYDAKFYHTPLNNILGDVSSDDLATCPLVQTLSYNVGISTFGLPPKGCLCHYTGKVKKCQDHFASFPEKLVAPCLKAGTSEKGCCPECLAPWERIVEKTKNYNHIRADTGKPRKKAMTDLKGKVCQETGGGYYHKEEYHIESKTIGWKPTCSCNLDYLYGPQGADGDRQGTDFFTDVDISVMRKVEKLEGVKFGPIPCTVMDIFAGSGTVAVVAEKHRRNWVGIELSSDYCELAKDRIQQATKQRRLF